MNRTRSQKSKSAKKSKAATPKQTPAVRRMPVAQKAVISSNPEIVSFGVGLRDLRMSTGMTLDQLSEKSELTPNYIGTIENGYRDPSLSTMQGLAVGLGIRMGELFGPPQVLSRDAMEMARLFNDAPEGVQKGMLILLRGMVKRLRS